MTTWYSPDEIKDQADGDQTPVEFAPETITEEPVVEGALAIDGAQELLDRQAEIKAITDTLPKTNYSA